MTPEITVIEFHGTKYTRTYHPTVGLVNYKTEAGEDVGDYETFVHLEELYQSQKRRETTIRPESIEILDYARSLITSEKDSHRMLCLIQDVVDNLRKAQITYADDPEIMHSTVDNELEEILHALFPSIMKEARECINACGGFWYA